MERDRVRVQLGLGQSREHSGLWWAKTSFTMGDIHQPPIAKRGQFILTLIVKSYVARRHQACWTCWDA